MAGRHSNNSVTLITSRTPFEKEDDHLEKNYCPHTRVTSARDTNPLSFKSMASHILRLCLLASGVLAQGSLALILSQLMMVTLAGAIMLVTPGAGGGHCDNVRDTGGYIDIVTLNPRTRDKHPACVTSVTSPQHVGQQNFFCLGMMPCM